MRAGPLRHRITIEEKSVARDAYADEIITWTTVATVWAAVEPLRGREFLEYAREGAELSTRIRMRYRSGIVPHMRVTWGDHVYDVVSVIAIEERNREIQLMCNEIVPETAGGEGV